MTTFEDINRGRALVPPEDQIADEDIDPNNVMPVMCPSCPWRSDAGRLDLGAEAMQALALSVTTEANQRCHAPSLSGNPETRICRGARDLQIERFYRLGVLEEPTDAAWAKALLALQG